MFFREAEVDSRVLEQDFESKGLHLIPRILDLLMGVYDIRDYLKIDSMVRPMLHELWFFINLGKGINLRDREKLLPVFKQLGRIFKKYTRLPQLIYRGVVLPEAFGTILTDKLPYTENKESIFNLIDGLAYGLRSWTDSKKNAIYWADNKDFPNRDSVVFISDTTDVIFDCNAFFNVIDSTGIRIRDTERPFDRDEFITYKQKPRVSNITRVYDRRYGDYGIWEVIVR